jgi:hypothetical protein
VFDDLSSHHRPASRRPRPAATVIATSLAGHRRLTLTAQDWPSPSPVADDTRQR